MSLHLIRAIDRLKQEILTVAGAVEERVIDAVRALQNRDRELARQVIDSDSVVDDLEVDVEEHCLEILALHQPVADQLRFIIAVLKINNDLERIADLAVNIAERASCLASEGAIEIPFDLETMSTLTNEMLRRSIDALVQMDSRAARAIRSQDDAIDQLTAGAFNKVEEQIRACPDSIGRLIQYLSCARHIERIADLAQNIAEDIIYLVEGEIVRHKPNSV